LGHGPWAAPLHPRQTDGAGGGPKEHGAVRHRVAQPACNGQRGIEPKVPLRTLNVFPDAWAPAPERINRPRLARSGGSGPAGRRSLDSMPAHHGHRGSRADPKKEAIFQQTGPRNLWGPLRSRPGILEEPLGRGRRPRTFPVVTRPTPRQGARMSPKEGRESSFGPRPPRQPQNGPARLDGAGAEIPGGSNAIRRPPRRSARIGTNDRK